MSKESRGHGIEHEPQFAGVTPEIDPSEDKADQLLEQEWNRSKLVDHVEHNVWEEPSFATQLNEAPSEEELTYENWLGFELERTTISQTWLVTLLVIAAAGPLGIMGAFFGGLSGGAGLASLAQLLGAVVMGPITEEITKVLLALWIVEKRPHFFSSIPQILLCAVVGGVAFAAIENLVYFHIYVPDHTPAFEYFRWTACTALHVTCSFIAGIGLSKIWINTMRTRQRPQLSHGIPWFIAAMTIHGAYNASMIVASMLGWLDFVD